MASYMMMNNDHANLKIGMTHIGKQNLSQMSKWISIGALNLRYMNANFAMVGI